MGKQKYDPESSIIDLDDKDIERYFTDFYNGTDQFYRILGFYTKSDYRINDDKKLIKDYKQLKEIYTKVNPKIYNSDVKNTYDDMAYKSREEDPDEKAFEEKLIKRDFKRE